VGLFALACSVGLKSPISRGSFERAAGNSVLARLFHIIYLMGGETHGNAGRGRKVASGAPERKPWPGAFLQQE
jgi:hypothetical protein